MQPINPDPQSLSNSAEKINMEKLRMPEPILFYDDIILFEDELADNGISLLSVKVVRRQSLIF